MKHNYQIDDFDYQLPNELIATHPCHNRDECRLLVATDNLQLSELSFSHIIDFIQPNDLLVLNDSKVIKARLFGNKLSGGKIEILVERIINNHRLICHIRSNKTIAVGLIIEFAANLRAEVCQKLSGLFELKILNDIDIYQYLEQYGEIPLPPYLNRAAEKSDEIEYQTVYAKELGSVAAPTAGLHFTEQLLEQIKRKNVAVKSVTLHVGSGTFKPVSVRDITQHKMHGEVYTISHDTIDLVRQTQARGGKIIAVGTTSLRTLEAVAQNNYQAGTFETDIFITPGYKFKVVDKLITNFHLPKSTLLMLVSAFAGYDKIRSIYQHAVKNKYRFFSYGDSMLLSCNNKEFNHEQ